MNKADLLSLVTETRSITVPGSDQTLTIRALSGAEVTNARKLSKSCVDETGKITNAELYLEYELFLTRCGLIDASGNQMLDKDEVRELSNRRHSLIVYIAKKVAQLSGIVGDSSEDAAKN